MPHLTLEYTDNIIENDFSALFPRVHAVLVNTLPTQLDNCKSRAICLDNYCVASGSEANAFVACRLRILSGRSEQVIAKVQRQLMALLEEHFATSLQTLALQISIEVSDISEYYVKN